MDEVVKMIKGGSDGLMTVILPCCGHSYSTHEMNPWLPTGCPTCKKLFTRIIIQREEFGRARQDAHKEVGQATIKTRQQIRL